MFNRPHHFIASSGGSSAALRTPLRSTVRIALPLTLLLLTLDGVQGQFSARDPGVRGGSVDAGRPLASLSPAQRMFFAVALDIFKEVNSVKGEAAGAESIGLGPRFNADSCAACHAQPAVGGSSPSAKHFPHIGPNPQTLIANREGATNKIPSFVTADGPVREARSKLDGGVHALFTITGRRDATNTIGVTGRPQTCQLAQPDFESMARAGNLSFRIPTPLFGSGLMETIADETILANMNAAAQEKRALGINGRPNRNGNDGTIARFGWKAQNKSLLLFSGEAYNVEQGVTNELFQNERGNPGEILPVACMFNSTPEDATEFEAEAGSKKARRRNTITAPTPSDLETFAIFMRSLDAPVPSATQPGGNGSIANGKRLFTEVAKCALCHTPALQAAPASITARLGPRIANLYSDLLLHDMGSGLADGIRQADAGPNDFRTSPLWGLGQRIFFLHDGRTVDLLEAIRQHKSPGSEANGSVDLFFALPEQGKQDVLNFLRSL